MPNNDNDNDNNNPERAKREALAGGGVYKMTPKASTRNPKPPSQDVNRCIISIRLLSHDRFYSGGRARGRKLKGILRPFELLQVPQKSPNNSKRALLISPVNMPAGALDHSCAHSSSYSHTAFAGIDQEGADAV